MLPAVAAVADAVAAVVVELEAGTSVEAEPVGGLAVAVSGPGAGLCAS